MESTDPPARASEGLVVPGDLPVSRLQLFARFAKHTKGAQLRHHQRALGRWVSGRKLHCSPTESSSCCKRRSEGRALPATLRLDVWFAGRRPQLQTSKRSRLPCGCSG